MKQLTIELDVKARAAYVRFKHGATVARSQPSKSGEVVIDLDEQEQVIGIEILDVDSIEVTKET